MVAAERSLQQAIASHLDHAYQLRVDSSGAGRDLGGNHFPSAASRALFHGVDAVVYAPTSRPNATDLPARIDHCTRATYELLQIAGQEGVRHVVYLSSLDMMVGHREDFQVNEDWCPVPDDSRGLAEYLGEFVCREFARENKLDVTVLRLGRVVETEGIAGQPFDPFAVDQQDVAQAVSLVLAAQLTTNNARLGAWSIFHVLSGSPQARFSMERAKRVLGYRPRFQG